ncbi:hypothetical protein KFE25_001925 [Diacronema lutheri]|uniref:Queuosine biosynthesis protein QueH n=2 Tax=Diacronema lutheri TaxID=2081491 RepID=A0A8J5XMK4_DIALT|nr:hypothetical protein KFE25_001925 [Diacronema lutheri]
MLAGGDAFAPRASMADFHYTLPDELIARYPASPRDSSRLLVSLAGLPAVEAMGDASAQGALAAHVARAARRLHAERAPAAGFAAAEGCEFVDCAFGDVDRLLPRGAHLVFNESRVFAARLIGCPVAPADGRGALEACERPDGGESRGADGERRDAGDAGVEVLLLAPDEAGIEPSVALNAPAGAHEWRAMVRAQVAPGATFAVGGGATDAHGALLVQVSKVHSQWVEEGEADGVEASVKLSVLAEPASGSALARGTAPCASAPLSSILDLLGQIPIPPYLRRTSEPSDAVAYQTVYSRVERTGSVAAPTAGLHFTERTLGALEARGILASHVALHVGAGTFRPVTCAWIGEHDMHSESFSLTVRELDRLARSADGGAPIVAVGTTSARALESAYWLGARALLDGNARAPAAGLHLAQWEAYRLVANAAARGVPLPSTGDALRALRALASATERGDATERELRASTSLCIAPGYSFRVLDGLLTNLHQPDSTLLLLVGALIGGADEVRALYRHAVAARYRFFSYGDACLLTNTQQARSEQAHEPRKPLNLVQPPPPPPSPPSTQPCADATHDDDERMGREQLANATHDDDERMGREQLAAAAPAGAAPADALAPTNGAPANPAPAERARWWGERAHEGARVLLHSCCAPCSGAMIAEMREAGLDVTIFFYNPNIHPRKEYELRKAENVRYAQQLGVPIIDADYDVDEWFRRARGLEFSPERGARCTMCFDMRMERTALYAHEHGFNVITTTNATSRWKDAAQVDASGQRAAARYDGVQYWWRDWQTDEMSRRKYEINAQQRFYKQEYCGCTYSLRDSNLWRAKQGLPPIDVGSSESVYSDASADSEEESRDVVAGFFRDSAAFEEELRATYARRRKGGVGAKPADDNW